MEHLRHLDAPLLLCLLGPIAVLLGGAWCWWKERRQ